MDKLPVCYGQGVDPYCPRCRSGEYLHNEDGNENNFCGQCGCPLDWSQMYNEDTDQAEERSKCGDCAEYCRDSEKETRGVCKAKGVFVRQSKPACKKHFRNATVERRMRMQELKKVDITVVRTPKYVRYECPHCGEEVEVDFDDFEDDRIGDYWPEWEGDTVICDECGAEFEIGNVEVD